MALEILKIIACVFGFYVLNFNLSKVKLMTYNKKYTYIIKDGQIIFNNGWAWIVVFQALNKRNFAIVKYCAGNYSVVEV